MGLKDIHNLKIGNDLGDVINESPLSINSRAARESIFPFRYEPGSGGRYGADGHHGVVLSEAAGAAFGRGVGRDDPQGGRHR